MFLVNNQRHWTIVLGNLSNVYQQEPKNLLNQISIFNNTQTNLGEYLAKSILFLHNTLSIFIGVNEIVNVFEDYWQREK